MLKPAMLLSMVALAAPASAQISFENTPPAAAPAPGANSAKGNDRLICERQEEIGSRLGGKKVCKTAAQWADERRQQRNDVEKVQQTVNQSPSQ